MASTSSEKILARFKGLQSQMREGEQPLFTMPVIWENATDKKSEACDLILTNQRVFGYIYTTFPRERLFLDALELDAIKVVSTRQKSFEAVFRELLISDGTKKVYLRAPRKKIEAIYAALRETIKTHAPATETALEASASEDSAGSGESPANAPTFGRQEIKQPLERSPLGITILLVGGLCLEVIGALIWLSTGSIQTGLPLCIAGIVAVSMATIVRRQLR